MGMHNTSVSFSCSLGDACAGLTCYRCCLARDICNDCTLSVPLALPASQQIDRLCQRNMRGAAGSPKGSQTACPAGMAPTVGSLKDALCKA